MAAGGHFGFWPLLGLAHTFTRGIGAQFCLNTSKYPKSTLKPSSALGGHGRSKYDPTNMSKVLPNVFSRRIRKAGVSVHVNTHQHYQKHACGPQRQNQERGPFMCCLRFLSAMTVTLCTWAKLKDRSANASQNIKETLHLLEPISNLRAICLPPRTLRSLIRIPDGYKEGLRSPSTLLLYNRTSTRTRGRHTLSPVYDAVIKSCDLGSRRGSHD